MCFFKRQYVKQTLQEATLVALIRLLSKISINEFNVRQT